jgi:hypothetical protein
MKYVITNILYDTDGEEIELPKKLVIDVPKDCEDVEGFLCDEISNVTGFCHFGFKFEKAKEEYNLVYKGVVLNKKPLTKAKADNEAGLILINYGYRPKVVKA